MTSSDGWLSRAAFLRRHRNPWGAALHVATYAGLAWALWNHHVGWALVLGLVEIANWLFMPGRDRGHPALEWVISHALGLIDAPRGVGRTMALGVSGMVAVFVPLGLWTHLVVPLILGKVALAALGIMVNRRPVA